ncbi:hypothetical protein [Bosea beijingensis]|uniref:hypothetical protein n=1 Tax=Bosea beijingensis TaxID=3068632 RepID=UPI002742799F|nr:hypothetical protein [Bosea sp. REN20]
MDQNGFPSHGPISCARCIAPDQRVAEVGRWRVVNDPGAWGSSDPLVLILGFSKGFTQADAYAQGDFDAVPFKGMRPRLTAALRAVGVLAAAEAVEERMRHQEQDFAFGSLVRCSLSRRVEEYDHPSATYSCTGSVMPLAFREEISRVVRACAETYLGNLPRRLRLVLMLGTTDSYIDSCRNLVRALHPTSFKAINSVSYASRGVTFCHISHPSPLNGHHSNWLAGSSATKPGRKREEAIEAVRQAGLGDEHLG